MELTIPVIKIAIVGIITFGAAIILKPLALVARDFLLWTCILTYMKNTKYEMRAQRYARLKAQYKRRLQRGDLTAHFAEETRYQIGEQEVTFEVYQKEQEARETLNERIYNNSRRINKELSIIGSLLRHFDLQESNPAILKIKHYEQREFIRQGIAIKEEEL